MTMAQVHRSEMFLFIEVVIHAAFVATQLPFIFWSPPPGQLPEVGRQRGVAVRE